MVSLLNLRLPNTYCPIWFELLGNAWGFYHDQFPFSGGKMLTTSLDKKPAGLSEIRWLEPILHTWNPATVFSAFRASTLSPHLPTVFLRKQPSHYSAAARGFLDTKPTFLFVCLFWGRFSLRSSGWSGLYYVEQAALKLRESSTSASRVLGLRVCTITRFKSLLVLGRSTLNTPPSVSNLKVLEPSLKFWFV